MYNKLVKRSQVYSDVAKLHIKTMEAGFLPTLGPKFLTLMYRCIDEAEFSTLIVEYKDNTLAGFVSGTLGTSSLYREMMNHPLTLLLSMFPAILSPKKVKSILNILLHMTGKERANYSQAELLTICVSGEHRRRGVAERLYRDLCSFFESSDVSKFTIVVGKSLDANVFYKKQGARVAGEVTVHSGAVSNVFVQEV